METLQGQTASAKSIYAKKINSVLRLSVDMATLSSPIFLLTLRTLPEVKSRR